MRAALRPALRLALRLAAALAAVSLVMGPILRPATAHAGGGWVPGRGHSYVESSFLYLSTDERYDAGGAIAPFIRLSGVDRETTYRDAGVYAFGEVGLGGGFGFEGDVSWRSVQSTEPATSFSTWGAGDLRVLVKRGFRAGALAWAVSLEGKMPLGYDEAEYPSLGSGHADFGFNLHAGLGATTGYAQAEIGMRARGGPARDEWPFAAQAGWNFAPRWQLIGDVRGNGLLGHDSPESASSPSPTDPESAFIPFDPQTASSSILMAGPGLALTPAPGFRFSVQAWRSLAGENTPAGWKWKLAVARVR